VCPLRSSILQITAYASYNVDTFIYLHILSSSCTANCPNGGSSQAFTYVYDRYGNRWKQTVTAGSGPQPSYAFTGAQNGGVPNNRMDSFSYDAAGNLLNDGTYSYTYDPENRIISASNGPTTYIYDAEGQRVGRAGNAGMDMIYDREGHVILYNATVAPDSPMVQLYVDGMHLGGYVINSAVTNADLYYDHADWLGTERAHSNMAGTLCEATASLPFGDGQVIRAINGGCADSNDVSPNHFTGKERDTESGLDNFGARYLGSSLGHFMSPDPGNAGANPGNPQTWNAYAYGLNNPLYYTDPTGRYVCDDSTECDTENDKKFAQVLATAQTAANGMKDANSSQYLDAQRAIDAYGEKGVDNGVDVKFSNDQANPGATQVSGVAGQKTKYNPTGQNIEVSFNTSVLANNDAGNIVHEGTHVADASAWVASGFSRSMDPTEYRGEMNAYRNQFYIYQAQGATQWNRLPGSMSIGNHSYLFTYPGATFRDVLPDVREMLANPPYRTNFQDPTPMFCRGCRLPQ
jgi:RHS repeat-associated protein